MGLRLWGWILVCFLTLFLRVCDGVVVMGVQGRWYVWLSRLVTFDEKQVLVRFLLEVKTQYFS